MITLFVSCKTQSAYKLRMIPFRIIVSILIIVFPIPTRAQSRDPCNSSCGSKGKTVPYPFGFSGSCPILLNCSGFEIHLGKLPVSSTTPKSIFLNLSAECHRPIKTIEPLFTHPNYLPTVNNSLLLQNCTTNTTTQNDSCVLSPGLFRDQFSPQECNSSSDSISCFSKQKSRGTTPFLRFVDVNATNCTLLFSSMLVNSSALSLQFQTLELAWWLSGSCRNDNTTICSTNSICEDVDGAKGFRCSCEDGFRGDGYRQGQGCQKSESNPPASFFSVHFIPYNNL